MELSDSNSVLSSPANGAPFCNGGGAMVMYMEGFSFSLKGNQPCLNLFFSAWTLDTRGKFLAAMIGIMALAVVTEGISKLRFLLSRRLNGAQRRWSVTGLHGLQAFVGYVLMLATMTFSLELFLCVILGLGIGFWIFYDDNDTHVTTNPCCNFLQDDANERKNIKAWEELGPAAQPLLSAHDPMMSA